jgi:hypothetical protein
VLPVTDRTPLSNAGRSYLGVVKTMTSAGGSPAKAATAMAAASRPAAAAAVAPLIPVPAITLISEIILLTERNFYFIVSVNTLGKEVLGFMPPARRPRG